MIRTFSTGGDRNLAYVLADDVSKKAALIDPSYDPEALLEYLEAQGLNLAYVFCTHGHRDHTNGNEAVTASTGVQALGYGDTDPATGIRVEDEAVFPLGDSIVRILHTPGHSADSICLLFGDALFTGDTLFVGKVGGTDLDAGARAEYDSLHNKLLKLPAATRIFPGHDVGVAPESTLEHERETNPFLLRTDVESFIDLKRNWAQYKKEHGIA